AFRVENEDGLEIPCEMTDLHTWRFAPGKNNGFHISYRVYANTLDGTFSQIDSSGASLNLTGILVYLVNYKHFPVSLRLTDTDQRHAVSALAAIQPNSFSAFNYDQLVDAPVDIGTFDLIDFTHRDITHTLLLHDPLPVDFIPPFIDNLKAIIDQHYRVFNSSMPYPRYTFFYHLNPGLALTDGMEHRDASRILLKIPAAELVADANTNDDYDNLIWLSAHEIFHAWHVKRLRPAGLGPFDYQHAPDTDALWIVEGLTSYYAYLSLIRSNIYTKDKFYFEFSNKISRFENHPAKNLRSLAEVSRLSWLFLGDVPSFESTNIDQTFYSYYQKGMLVALLLDIEIRARTGNRSSLDTVMAEMYKQYYLEPVGTYYMRGTGYTTADFIRMVESISGSDFQDFFRLYVFGRGNINYNDYLSKAGLVLEPANFSAVPNNPISYILKETDSATSEMKDILTGLLEGKNQD
ncbi:MAG: M61 family peptidase, partial [Calditrichales bacterium]